MTKKIIITVFSTIVVCIALFFVVNQYFQKNKETIVDLGDGWKSYSHQDIGITVKIPEDAEIKSGREGDKNDYFVANFSKGAIKSATVWFNEPWFSDFNNLESAFGYHSSFGACGESNGKWIKNALGNRNMSECEELEIDGKLAIIFFGRFEDNMNQKVSFKTYKLSILDKNGEHYLLLDPSHFLVEEGMTNEKQHFTEEEIKNFKQKHIEMVKDLILSVDIDY